MEQRMLPHRKSWKDDSTKIEGRQRSAFDEYIRTHSWHDSVMLWKCVSNGTCRANCLMVKGCCSFPKLSMFGDRHVRKRVETRQNTTQCSLQATEWKNGDPLLMPVEAFGTPDDDTATGLLGESIRPLQRSSVVWSSSKWHRYEDPFFLSHNWLQL